MTFPLRIHSAAAATIADHCAAAPGMEIGGVIAGTVDFEEVRYVSGPGPAAELAAGALLWDAAYIEAWILAQWARPRTDNAILGRWHKHPLPVLSASAEDKAGAEAFRQALGLEAMFDLIVACGGDDEPIGWAAYRCTVGGYERIDVQPP